MSIVYVVQAMNLDESMSLEGIFSSEKLAEEYCMVAGRKNPAWSLLYFMRVYLKKCLQFLPRRVIGHENAFHSQI